MYRVWVGLDPVSSWEIPCSMVLSCPSSNFLMPMFTRPRWIFPSMVPVVQYLFTLVTPLCSFHSWKTHHPFLSMVINYEADNMYTTRIKPFLPTFQQLVNPSCGPYFFVSPYLLISRVAVELNLWTHKRSMKTLRDCNFELLFI